MNDNLFSAVTLDGKELNDLSTEQIKDLYFSRQINQDSLVRSPETQKWQMLKRTFDVSQWVSGEFSPPISDASNRQNQFAPPNSPSFTEITPPISPRDSLPPNNFQHNAANHHPPQNQNEFHHQPRFSVDKYDFANNFQATNFGERTGARQAAVFLGINAVFLVISIIVESLTGFTDDDAAGRFGRTPIIALIIDLVLAARLWKNHNIESTRRCVLARSYFGLAVFGLIVTLL